MLRLGFSRAAVAALLVAGLVGCKAQSHDADATDRGLVSVDHVGGHEIEAAVKDLCQKIADRNAKGWPPHIHMDSYGKPQITIDLLQNRTREHFDTTNLQAELENQITEQDVCSIVNRSTRHNESAGQEAVMDERDYSQSGMTGQDQVVEHGQEDASGLVLEGTITDDVMEEDGVKQHDYWFNLKLIDTTKAKDIITTRTKLRRVRE
jgi:hypothetical protein